MLPVNWKTKAQDDLAEIIDYIEQRNTPAAQDLHQTMEIKGSVRFFPAKKQSHQ